MVKIWGRQGARAAFCCWIACSCAACGASEEGEDVPEQTPEPEPEAEPEGDPLPDGCDALVEPSDDDQEALQGAFIDAASDSTICLAAGTFSFKQQLSLGADGVTIRGAGPEATILDFTAQDVGANGLRVTGNRVTLEDFQILNTPGDGIRVDDVEDITFRRVHVIWEAESSQDNGAYGLYPVGCQGVLIEQCLVVGARDAGIYVGQSRDIVVRDNEARGNVAGIEIENSLDADVHNNHSHDNTAGILIFDLPDLDQFGGRAKVRDNLIEDNNRDNFAQAGNIVARVPKGSGLFILASDDNEIHNNDIRDNDSFGAAVVSYSPVLTGEIQEDPNYDIFPQGNWIHDNTFEGNGTAPDVLLRAIQTDVPFPDLAWDGCEDPEVDNTANTFTNCFSDNGGATYLNFKLCGGENETDITPVTCTHPALPEIDK